MNVGVILDLGKPLAPAAARGVRELLFALNSAKDMGDRFFIAAAGRENAIVLEPQKFGYGHLTVELPALLAGAPEGLQGVSLPEAVAAAVELVRSGTSLDAPLGSSELLFVTAAPIGPSLRDVLALAQESALSGITMSAVAVGQGADEAELEELALAGQGSRRTLAPGTEAKELVEQELSSASRVAARALRLRIRLAPGVKLVDVPGSYRLDQAQAEHERQAEKSIDQRVARNLGIEADRGEDEEGIQIIIPAFYSGDSHVVLLDVVVPGPGPAADVQVRYKDLIHMRNGILSATLALDRGDAPPGKLEQNVLKNLLALRMSASLEAAAALLSKGQDEKGLKALHSYEELLRGIARRFPVLERDSDIAADIAVLRDYDTALRAGTPHAGAQQDYLADSLRLAAARKAGTQTREPD